MGFISSAFEYYSGKDNIHVNRILKQRDAAKAKIGNMDWDRLFPGNGVSKLYADAASLEKGGVRALPALYRAYQLGTKHPYNIEGRGKPDRRLS